MAAVAPDFTHSSGNESRVPRLWTPKRVFVTRSARDFSRSHDIAARAASRGAAVTFLDTNRLPRLSSHDGQAYAQGKSTLAIVVPPASSFKLQPIPPSADWQFHFAKGCPAHCQYCYLAGSLAGAPITRVYPNIEQILANLQNYAGRGAVTSRSEARQAEGTTFEASCYTDPLALEHLTGALADSIRYFGAWDAPVQLRWTTKFDNVESLLVLPHKRRTRVRFSVNAAEVARKLEGGTPPLQSRLDALRRMALAGYPVGLTVAPIMYVPDWENAYAELFCQIAATLDGVPALDLTAELITHRFTPGSKEILLKWYPRTPLDMNESERTRKRNKFGSFKYVYPADRMQEMRRHIGSALAEQLPAAKVLYWT